MRLIALALAVGLLAAPAPARGQTPAPPAPAAPAAPKPARMGLTIPTQAWTGDLDGMIKRRQIRVLVPYSKTFFFVDKGVQRGIVATKLGLDRNVWFDNVERVAADKIGRETVTYVSNISKYYIAYRLVQGEYLDRESAKKQLQSPSPR